MNESDAIDLIQNSKSMIFTTREFSTLANISMTFASHMLRRLAVKKRILRIFQGLWAVPNPSFNAYQVVPFLTRPHLAAVSLLSALQLHGMIEQIPQVIFVVSTSPTRKIHTPVGDYSLHQITPKLFDGYEMYSQENHFLLATPEKALVDCLYFSCRKRNRFHTFPELSLPKNFKRTLVLYWIQKIPYPKIRMAAQKKWESLYSLGSI